MKFISLLLSFAPWIALWVIAWGHSLFRLQLALVVASVLVVVMAVTRLHRGVILWAGVLFFGTALVAVVFMKNMWFVTHMGVLSHGTLFAGTLVSMLCGCPFTLDYAREHTPEELWHERVFVRTCYIVAGVWLAVFGFNVCFGVFQLYHPLNNDWLKRGVELSVMLGAIVFTTRYPARVRRKRLEAETVKSP